MYLNECVWVYVSVYGFVCLRGFLGFCVFDYVFSCVCLCPCVSFSVLCLCGCVCVCVSMYRFMSDCVCLFVCL